MNMNSTAHPNNTYPNQKRNSDSNNINDEMRNNTYPNQRECTNLSNNAYVNATKAKHEEHNYIKDPLTQQQLGLLSDKQDIMRRFNTEIFDDRIDPNDGYGCIHTYIFIN
jgi:hypothetical protein